MAIAVKIIGIIFVFLAVVYLMKPAVMRGLMKFFGQGKRMYFAALIRFILAVIFLLAAGEHNRHAWVIIAFGIVFMISGVLIFILGIEKVKSIIGWWQRQSTALLRALAVITLAMGAVIIYCA